MYPKKIFHWIEDKITKPSCGKYFNKIDPSNGNILAKVARGNNDDVINAVTSAERNFENWSNTNIVERGLILRRTAELIKERIEEIAFIIHTETGKSVKDAKLETHAAIELGYFISGEGRRFYGQTTSSAQSNRMAMTIRQPVGIAGLIVPFNTPIANTAWKTFPALICGNTVVLKASKDTPFTPLWFSGILKEAGLPKGVFSVIQGYGEEAGKAIVENNKVDLISFTGSSEAGTYIQTTAGKRMAKVSLEMGGKNVLVVCNDADIESAVEESVMSSFSNAGQRCASASRILVFKSVYKEFLRKYIERTRKLKIGTDDGNDLGPVINLAQLSRICEMINRAVRTGDVKIAIGGSRLVTGKFSKGFFVQPTILEMIRKNSEIYQEEIFGPVALVSKIEDLYEAIQEVNNHKYGLTCAIHSSSIHKIQEFIKKTRIGVVSVNGATYGSEPHMPFGGLRQSGNGFREPGTQSLDFYSEWKTVYVKHDPSKV